MKNIMVLIMLALIAASALAVPADPSPVTVRQPDGTAITVRGFGDERYNYSETKDGFVVVPRDGWLEYARVAATGEFTPSGIRATDDGSIIEQLVRQRIAQHLREAASVVRAKQSSHNDQYLGAIDMVVPGRGKAVNRVLVLMVKFTDVDSTYNSQSFQQMINQDGWHSGSMNQYYQQTSYGQQSLTADYQPWIRSSQSMAYYAYSNPSFSTHVKQLVREAVDSAEAHGVNFALYDNNNDGTVDGLFVVHVGQGAEEGGLTQYIWSHSSSLSYAGLSVVYDGKTISPYIIMPEKYNDNHIEIGVFCHEYGHALGLPDLYDTDTDPALASEGVGNYCLMGAGSWGGNGSSPQLPVQMSPWCKKQKGWLTFDTIKVNTLGRKLPPVEFTPMALKVWSGGAPGNQYFFVENRRRQGFDANLPNQGLLIWHIDESAANNNNQLHKKVDVECATGMIYGGGTKDYLDTTASGWARYNWGDYWCPATGKTAFDPFSNPNTNSYTPALTQVAVYNIQQAAGDTMLMDIFIGGSNLTVSNARLNDAAGDHDSLSDPGESVGLAVTLANTAGWANATVVTARLSTADTSILVTDSTATFANINAGASATCSGDSFVFYVKPGAFPHKAKLAVTKYCSQGSYDLVDTVVVTIGTPRVLLVDDDKGFNYEQYYQAPLDTLNVLYRTWTVASQGSPAFDTLAAYPIVVWFTGNDSLTTLTSVDTANVKAYLNGGGKLFLCSKQLGQQLGSTGFYADYLHASYVANNAGQIFVRGCAGNPIGISVGDTLALGGAAGANNATSLDKLTAINGADSAFLYRTTGGAAAVTYSGAYKLVYFGFPFEAMGGVSPRYTQRTEIMRRIMDWFGGVMPVGVSGEPDAAGPEQPVIALSRNAPNPFSAATGVTFQLGESARVQLALYNVLGQQVAILVNGPLGAGRHSVSWDGRDQSGRQMPNGIYFFRLESPACRTAVRKAMLLR